MKIRQRNYANDQEVREELRRENEKLMFNLPSFTTTPRPRGERPGEWIPPLLPLGPGNRTTINSEHHARAPRRELPSLSFHLLGADDHDLE